jgi:hypothetical protein
VTRYRYSHPEQSGLGEHHVNQGDPPLHERPAQPPEAAAALRGALAMVSPTPEQAADLEAFLARTMADLDMPHGTEVEHLETAENGHEIVAWIDRHDDARNTSVTPELFATHFQAVN